MRVAGERTVFCLMAVIAAVASGQGARAAQNARTADAAPISFQVKPEVQRPPGADAAIGFAVADLDAPEARLDGGFGLASSPALVGDARILDADRYYDGVGPVTWRSNGFSRQAQAGGPIDSVRISMAGARPTAAYAPLTLLRPEGEAGYTLRELDVTVTRGWPSALALQGRRFALDVTPHAGLGYGGAGGSAEAGATVRLGKKRNMGARVNEALGVQDGAETFGDRGRWYIFAAASGRAVGLNMLRGQNGDWSRAGLTQDTTSKLIGDSQAGVAWRKGPMQASLGYIHRAIKSRGDGIMGLATQKDDVVALSFSLKPQW